MDSNSTEAIYRDAGVTFIETQEGNFYPSDPVFNVDVIAHALGMNCRFNGHVRHFYSVAEHSVMVSRMMEQLGLGDPLEGLLHDATEAYLSDIPAPFKQFLPDVQAFDANLEESLRFHFGLPAGKSKGCKEADWYALFIEGYWLLPSRGETFLDVLGLRGTALAMRKRFPIYCLTPEAARLAFLQRYDELTESRGLSFAR